MLSARTYTLLRICSSWWGVGCLLRTEEIRNELVHPCISKQQAWGLGHQRCRGHDCVLLGLKEVEEGLTDFGGGHGNGKIL